MIFAHEITFHELMASKQPVVTTIGEMIGGPDRSAVDIQVKWQQWKYAFNRAVPPLNLDVTAYYLKHGASNKPPEDILIGAPKKNGNPPKFTWSYTSLDEFLRCPAAWAAKRYFKVIKDGETEAMRVGNLIHSTAEHYTKSLTGQTFKPAEIHAQYLPMIKKYCDALVASGAEIKAEQPMCFNSKMGLSGWWAPDVWVRAKADILAKKGQRLSIIDWKSGKVKDDFLQLKMFAVFAALTPGYEDVAEFDPKFIFVKELDTTKAISRLPEPIKRSELKGHLGLILEVVRRMESAWENENFPAHKNGLCKNYCANTKCAHCGG